MVSNLALSFGVLKRRNISSPRLPTLDAVPRRTDLDIKVIGNPTTVADLEGKVLTFLGALDTPQNRENIAISDVEYAVICPRAPID